ncbi:MAG: hypothetical protein HYT98_00440 [Candidatus Sungbacteria bacterium]|nr:hypothetical protein [Candidatus Sungbacteria bacterium]
MRFKLSIRFYRHDNSELPNSRQEVILEEASVEKAFSFAEAIVRGYLPYRIKFKYGHVHLQVENGWQTLDWLIDNEGNAMEE